MKELHNHIFSNTTCISKETMLRYINKQLSKQELHDVEKHMLDCELCSDAYEGLKYAHNSSMLFAIDNQIDQRVRAGESRAPIMRNLMVAASILLIASGAFFTFNYFNKTVDNEKELAINTVDNEPKQQTKNAGQVATGESMNNNTPENILQTQKQAEITDTDANEDFKSLEKDAKYRNTSTSNEPLNAANANVTNQDNGVKDLPNAEVTDEVSLIELKDKVEKEDKKDNLSFSSRRYDEKNEKTEVVIYDRKEISKKESEKLPEGSGAALKSGDETGDHLIPEVDNNVSENANFGYTQTKANKVSNEESLKVEDKTLNNRAKNSKGKKKSKAPTAPNPQTYYSSGKLEEEVEFEAPIEEEFDDSKRQTVTINSYKVVDYTEEYQKQYELSKTIEPKSVTADFETKADKDAAEKEREEATVEITYKQTLEKAISLYKNKKYNEAIAEFDVILSKHPDEVNGLFYGGLSNYHMQRYGEADKKFDQVLLNEKTQFNEEAKWYKALSLIELKQTNEAKKLLNEIISANGFYKAKAEEKLKGL